MFKFIVSAFVVAVFSFFQTANLFIFEVKPNFVLVALLITFLIEKYWPARIALLSIAVLIINFLPSINLEILTFIVTIILAGILIDALASRPIISLILVVSISTLIIGAINFSFTTVGLEIAYNLALSLVGYKLISFLRLNEEI